MNSQMRSPQPELVLIVMNGPDRGTQFKLVGREITIGRGTDNNISFKNDAKMSRHHAVIRISSKGISIEDVSDRNTLYVNDLASKEENLETGAIIQLGETQLQFRAGAQNMLQEVTHINALTGKNSPRPPHRAPDLGAPTFSQSSRKKAGPNFFYIIVGAIGVLALWLFMSENKQKVVTEIRDNQAFQTDLKDNQEVVAEIKAERDRLGLNSRKYEEAQPHFIKGFRDYKKGQYGRAIDSFQACKSLFPDHPQCKRYMDLAQKKFDELIHYHMILANKYRAQNQFSACKASYRNAMIMIKNPENRNYLEAKSGFDVCQALEGDGF